MTKIYTVDRTFYGPFDHDERETFEAFSNRRQAEQMIEGLTGRPTGQWDDGQVEPTRWTEGDFEIRELTLR